MRAAPGIDRAVTVPPMGFMRAEGIALVDDAGVRVPRGVGLGNWLLPEGYMWLFGPGAESPREIEALVARLAGEDYAREFWRRFRDEYITEADIARIAAMGFDHVRVPINARVIQDESGAPLADGYALLDRVVRWCRSHGLRALLDLHGAPGGQTGTNIDDSPHGRPDLFLEPGNAELTVRLWSDLASHFATDDTVMGYDLLNEPLPHEWRYELSDSLVDLYQRLTAAIREVDDRHLVMYEGTHWATDFSAFTQRWDDNQVIQFHRYWSRPDREGIADHLALRERLGAPLYMGEGGENTPEWIYTAMRLYEAEGIGWNLWPWKKLDTATSPVSITPPEGWEAVRASIGAPSLLSAHDARTVFDALLDGVSLDQAREVPAVVEAALGRSPLSLPAWGFGFRGEGASSGGATGQGLDTFRTADGVTIRHARDGVEIDNPFQQADGRTYTPDERLVVRLPAEAWLEYELSDADVRGDRWVALDASGARVPATVTPSDAGITVTASEGPITFASLVRDPHDTMGV